MKRITKTRPGGLRGQLWLMKELAPVCTRCGRPLTSAESVRLGAGPVCIRHTRSPVKRSRSRRAGPIPKLGRSGLVNPQTILSFVL